MTGKSLRRAFRKFFRIRKSRSDSGMDGRDGSVSALEDHRCSGTHGCRRLRTSSKTILSSDADTVPEIVVSPEKPILDTALSIRLAHQSLWYWGPINAAVAETILEKEKDGTFLVRDSTDDRFLFSLSCKYDGKVGHIRIEHNGGHFMFRKIDSYKSDNIRDFVEKAIENSHSGSMQFMTRPRPGVDATRILLLYPLSRQQTVQSLQHLARFTILECLATRDAIAHLPIPLQLKKYLNKSQYFVELDRRARPGEPGV